MNVTTEQKENCVLDFHVELPPERFKAEWKRIAEEYCQLARIPGFRKGKAPLSAVEKKFSKEIREEALEKTIKAALQEILAERKLELVRYPDIKDVQLKEDDALHFIATLIFAPQLELGQYKGLEVAVERDHVSEERVEEVLEKMREDFAEFSSVEGRGLEMGDFAVLDYEGTTADGKALLELDAGLPLYFVGGKNRWLKLEEKLPIPGLAEALLGLTPSSSREYRVAFPENFSQKALAGVTVVYQILLHEIKTRQLAPLDDTLAAKVKPGLTVATLREEVKMQLEGFLDQQFQSKLRTTVVEALLKQNGCEPPAVLVQQESASILEKIIRDNHSRGVPEEEIRSHQQELVASAQKSAEEKVQLHFVLHAIAAKEGITVTQEELTTHLTAMAEHYRTPLKKVIQQIQKNRALSAIQEELLFGKTLSFVTEQAKVTELPPSKTEAHEHVHGPHCNH